MTVASKPFDFRFATLLCKSSIDLFASLERAFPGDQPHPRLPRQRPLSSRSDRPGLDAAARAADRPALRAVLLPAPQPDRTIVEGNARNATRNKRYGKFRDFAEAVLGFLRETVPRRLDELSSTITDNFRVIDPKVPRDTAIMAQGTIIALAAMAYAARGASRQT